MAYPEYADVEEPLLAAIYLQSGLSYSVRPQETYELLADYFELTDEERNATRHQVTGDGREETYWSNRVQWARRKLKDNGFLDTNAGHGVWRLSQKGIEHAKKVIELKPELLQFQS